MKMELIRFSQDETLVGQSIEEFLSWHDAGLCGMVVAHEPSDCRLDLLVSLDNEVQGEYEFRFTGVRRHNLQIPCADFRDSNFRIEEGFIHVELETLFSEVFVIEAAFLEIAPGDRERFESGVGYGKVL